MTNGPIPDYARRPLSAHEKRTYNLRFKDGPAPRFDQRAYDLHPTYELEQSNAWWGPQPCKGVVAVAHTRCTDSREHPPTKSFLTIINGKHDYEALASIHPHVYGPGWVEEAAHWYLPQDPETPPEDRENPFVWDIAEAHYTWGITLLHHWADRLRYVMRGSGKDRESMPWEERSSPYRPHGPWEWVPPEAPFDYRVRARMMIPKTKRQTRPLEDLLVDVIGSDIAVLLPHEFFDYSGA